VGPLRGDWGGLGAGGGSRQRPRWPAARVAAAACGGPAVPAARERPGCATILPPSPPAGRRYAACARAAQGQAAGRGEAPAALQALAMAALPAIALAPPSRSTAAAPRAARARRALRARPLPPALVPAATWNLRRAGPPAAACRLRPADGGKPPRAARRPRARYSARPPRRSDLR